MYWKVKKIQSGIPMIKWKVLRKRHAHNQKKRQCISYLNKKYIIANFKRENSLNKRTDILVPADRETNINLKTATQKSDVINQSHNIIKDTSTLA